MDQDDLSPAKNFLASDCEYKTEGKLFFGPDDIIAEYQQHADHAKTTFDKVIYKSQIQQRDQTTFEATYKDIISKDGITHTYRCKQIFKFNAQAKIYRIEHISIPGEIEAFREFYKKVGLS